MRQALALPGKGNVRMRLLANSVKPYTSGCCRIAARLLQIEQKCEAISEVIAAIAAGPASIRTSAMQRGSSARSRRSSMHLRSRRFAGATGLSLAACSRIRSGARVPHPRQWDALLASVAR
jgi:hypothetical protein